MDFDGPEGEDIRFNGDVRYVSKSEPAGALPTIGKMLWPHEALILLALERDAAAPRSGSKSIDVARAASTIVGASKRAAEDELIPGSQHGPSIRQRSDRVIAPIKRSKRDGNQQMTQAPVDDMAAEASTLEDTYARFWSNDKPVVSINQWNESGPVQYTFEPLEHEDAIRLLCLRPATDGPLLCQLITVRLSELPVAYEAISYAWSSPSTSVNLETTDGEIPMCSNLYSCLQHLRLHDRPTYLWAYAACVNQSDIVERNHLVASTRYIYSAASSVVAWLGPDQSHKARMAFAVICSIASGGEVNGEGVGQAHFFSNGVSSANIPDLPCRDGPPKESFAVLWKHVQDLFSQDWFSRLWSIQEIMFAKSTSLQWGNCQIPWLTVGLAADRLRTRHPSIVQRYTMPAVFNVYLIYRLSTPRVSVHPIDEVSLDISFLKLLALTSAFTVHDPRDRVYALLGIPTSDCKTTPGELFVKPDYKLSEQPLNQAVAEMALLLDRLANNSANLALMLSSVQRIDSDNSQPGSIADEQAIPSWVPNWSQTHSSFLLSFNAMPMLQSNLQATIVQQPVFALEISALICCKMTGQAQIASDVVSTPELNTHLETEQGKTIVAMTLTAGKQWSGSPAQPQAQKHDFDAYCQMLNGNGTEDDHLCAYRFAQAMHNAVPDRALLAAESPISLGLGPIATQVGDELALLAGTLTAFILRPVSNPVSEEQWHSCPSLYRLVGECYFHGLGHHVNPVAPVLERIWII